MNMNQMLFLSNLFQIDPRNQSCELTKKSSSTSQKDVSSQDFKDYKTRHPNSSKTIWTGNKYNGN